MCGGIAVLEERFRDRDFFMGLLALEEVGDMIPHLQDTVLREYLTPGAEWEDFTEIAKRCFYDTALAVRSMCPSSGPVDVFVAPYDFMNLKTSLAQNTSFPYPFVVFPEDQLVALAKGELPEAPESLKEWPGWSTSEIQHLAPLDLDILLDGAYLRYLLHAAEGIGSDFIRACVRERVKAKVVTLLWRAHALGIPLKRVENHLQPLGELTGLVEDLALQSNPQAWAALVGGEIGDVLAEVQEWGSVDRVPEFASKVDDRLLSVAALGGMQTSGPEAVFSFMAGFEHQLRLLTLVVTGRLGGVDRDGLRRRIGGAHG